MKTTSMLLLLVGMLPLFSGCQEKEVVVNRPTFSVRNSNTLEFDKVVINDTATLLYVDAFYQPKYWIRIDSATYIQAGGKKYQITGSDSIKLHQYHWMPESGESSFVLKFPPIPRNTTSFDFIESDCESCFKVYGIQLKPEAKDLLAEIPSDIRNADYSKAELPYPDLKAGETTVKFHLLGYREGLFNPEEVTLIILNFLSQSTQEEKAVIDKNGDCVFKYTQYGPCGAFLLLGKGNFSFPLFLDGAADEEIWVDLQEASNWTARYQNPEHKRKQAVFMRGKYAALNEARTNTEWQKNKQMHLDAIFYDSISNKNAEMYLSYIQRLYQPICDSIAHDKGLSPLQRDLITLEHNLRFIEMITEYPSIAEYAYRKKNQIDYKSPIPNYKPIQLTQELVQPLLNKIDLNSPNLFYTSNFNYLFSDIYHSEFSIFSKEPGSFFDNLAKIAGIAEDIENMRPLTKEQEKCLASIPDPFYAQAIELMHQENEKIVAANKNKSGFFVRETPQVTNEQLFEKIISPYKGKVVFVDFWATWCGPCRTSIKQNEPIKEEFNPENIVFVYITGETSPFGIWNKMIPDIKGEHYRVTDEQWENLHKQFGIDGIPSYVIVSKDGSYKLRNDLRDHAIVKSSLQKEIEM